MTKFKTQNAYRGQSIGRYGAVTMEAFSAAAHDGFLFRTEHTFDTLNNGGVLNFSVLTSASPINSRVAVTLKSEGAISIYEGPTVTSAGTALTILNIDRTSANTPVETVNIGTNVSALGTTIVGSAYISPYGHTIDTGEHVFAAGSTYYIRLGSLAAANRGTITFTYFQR